MSRAYSIGDVPEKWLTDGRLVTITHDGQPLIAGRLNVVMGRVVYLDLETTDGTVLPTRFEVPVGATVRAG